MEDDLKIVNVEYFSNHWSNLPQIWKLNLKDQTKIKIAHNEDDLQLKSTSKYPLWNISTLNYLNTKSKYEMESNLKTISIEC